MKYIFLVILLLPTILFAQENTSHLINAKVKQGSILVGGNVSGSLYKYRDEISSADETFEGTNIVALARAKGGYFFSMILP
ncbi:hypothetical protein [Pontibacter harenae]|uniref:hypothetical protein n=1 Tax=Pontibacter harenae TaxID=2894083 RepID=UPI001E4B38E9|nr:hypothetical protein [Pontibacter harenae]MCC9168305.1 hypothetical protein [Pontibacter harenae]